MYIHDKYLGSKWVVIGVSYGGTLATWARFKYPKLITHAIAINAPLKAKVDFGEYYENVVKSLNKCIPKCVERITQANRELENTIKNEKDRNNVAKMFQLCDTLTEDPDDVSSLFAELAENFAHSVDFTGTKKNSPTKGRSLSELCDVMINPDTSALNAYAEVNRIVMAELKSTQKCLEHSYKNKIEKLKRTNYGDASKMNADRQWIYQSCVEFGFFQSSSKSSEIFGNHFPVTFFTKICKDLFGSDFNIAFIEEKVSDTHKNFIGLENNITNVTFIYDTEDPWHDLFITNNKTGCYRTYKKALGTYSCPNLYGGYKRSSSHGSSVAPSRGSSVTPSLGSSDASSRGSSPSSSHGSSDSDGFLKNMDKTLGCIINDGNNCLSK